MKPFRGVGGAELVALQAAFESPLSGYLAGRERGGHHVRELEDAWCETFGCKHAIAVNSATSGLLAAAFAVGLGPGDHFVCSPMTMSATVAAPMFTGATPIFGDVEDETFGLVCPPMPITTKAVFTTNLFGHPSPLGRNEWDKNSCFYVIEDNAQSPFAMAFGRYAGTMGHIGVFSLNFHKPIQCGEGGVITTDDDDLAQRMRNFINHGEHLDDRIGLNLRMPELCAAVAREQLRRGPEIVTGRVEQAEAVLAAIGDIPGLRPPVTRTGCTHVYYTIPFLMDLRAGTADCDANAIVIAQEQRAGFCRALHDQGIPITIGYVEPLYRMPAFAAFKTPCPIAEDLHDRRLFYFENTAWDCDKADIIRIGDAFKRAAETWLK